MDPRERWMGIKNMKSELKITCFDDLTFLNLLLWGFWGNKTEIATLRRRPRTRTGHGFAGPPGFGESL